MQRVVRYRLTAGRSTFNRRHLLRVWLQGLHAATRYQTVKFVTPPPLLIWQCQVSLPPALRQRRYCNYSGPQNQFFAPHGRLVAPIF